MSESLTRPEDPPIPSRVAGEVVLRRARGEQAVPGARRCAGGTGRCRLRGAPRPGRHHRRARPARARTNLAAVAWPVSSRPARAAWCWTGGRSPSPPGRAGRGVPGLQPVADGRGCRCGTNVELPLRGRRVGRRERPRASAGRTGRCGGCPPVASSFSVAAVRGYAAAGWAIARGRWPTSSEVLLMDEPFRLPSTPRPGRIWRTCCCACAIGLNITIAPGHPRHRRGGLPRGRRRGAGWLADPGRGTACGSAWVRTGTRILTKAEPEFLKIPRTRAGQDPCSPGTAGVEPRGVRLRPDSQRERNDALQRKHF